MPSYRMAIEDEIHNWKNFQDALQSEEEKQAFDLIMNMCRSQAMAGSNACNPILFEPMVSASMSAKADKGSSKRTRCHTRVNASD